MAVGAVEGVVRVWELHKHEHEAPPADGQPG